MVFGSWVHFHSPNYLLLAVINDHSYSMILADGLIVATDGANKIYLIEPDPAGFKPLTSADLLKQGGLESRN